MSKKQPRARTNRDRAGVRACAGAVGGREAGGPAAPEPAEAPAPRMLGYARVSTAEQNLDRQLDALAAFGVPEANVFADHASGKSFDRPAWRLLLDALRPGDVLVVPSIDRLGRNYSEVLRVWRELTKDRGVAVVVLDMPLLDTRGRERGGVTGELISDIVLQLLSYVAEVERENIGKRQREGIRAAKARGVHLGRPRKRRSRAYRQAREAYLAGRITRAEAAARCGCGVTTFDKWLREDGTRRGETACGVAAGADGMAAGAGGATGVGGTAGADGAVGVEAAGTEMTGSRAAGTDGTAGGNEPRRAPGQPEGVPETKRNRR